MFDGLKQRHQIRRRQEDDSMLLRIYHRGYRARLEGRTRTPPPGYDAAIALDLVGWWTAGWEEADRVLARAEHRMRAA
jgi:ribosome modulation factor